MDFLSFYGKKCKNASYFLDDLEMAFLASRWDENEIKLKYFPLVLRDKAQIWFQGLPGDKKSSWDTLKETFLSKYVTDSSPEKLWQKLIYLQQSTIGSYSLYKAWFLKL